MSRLIHFHAFTPATNQRPPYLNPYYLPPAVIVSPIRWALDEQICIASITEPALLGRPRCKTYVLISLKSTLLCSLHATLGSGHPGSQRTLSLIQARVLVAQFCLGCLPVCSWMLSLCHLQNSTSLTCQKIGPIPRRPCSHVGVDFITDLPNSEGFTCISVAVDRFFKTCK